MAGPTVAVRVAGSLYWPDAAVTVVVVKIVNWLSPIVEP